LPEGGRLFVLAIAHEQIRAGNERVTKSGADGFIARLPPTDLVSIVTLPKGRVVVQPTTNHALARRELGLIVGHATQAIPSGDLADVIALRELIEGLREAPGRKTIIYVSEGLAAASGPGIGAAFKDLLKAADAVRVCVFAVQPHNSPLDASLRSTSELGTNYEMRMTARSDGLEDLAAMTGGEFFRVSDEPIRSSIAFSDRHRPTTWRLSRSTKRIAPAESANWSSLLNAAVQSFALDVRLLCHKGRIPLDEPAVGCRD
jgi:hypothetical protein